MNIELEEVVMDVSDNALELAAGGAQGGPLGTYQVACPDQVVSYCWTGTWC